MDGDNYLIDREPPYGEQPPHSEPPHGKPTRVEPHGEEMELSSLGPGNGHLLLTCY